MVEISITIEGLNQVLNFMSRFPGQYKNELTNTLSQIGDKGVKEFKNNAHVITGKMKGGIKKGKATQNMLEINSPVKYSGFENQRGGAHAFFDKGVQEIEKIAQQEINNATQRAINRK